MSELPGHAWLQALGRSGPPQRFEFEGESYALERVYKHDFYAATALYRGDRGRVVLKIGRTAPFLFVPLAWLGRALAEREARMYRLVDDLEGVPRFLGTWSTTGIVHDFVAGHPLQPKERVADDFFDRLQTLLTRVHERDIAYADLEKRENILVDEEGHPALIDFQISWHWPEPGGPPAGWLRWLPHGLGRRMLKSLQNSDRYHLQKHRRRHRRDQMSALEIERSYELSRGIRWHRRFSDPIRRARRALLQRLTGRVRSPKQDGPEFLEPIGRDEAAGPGRETRPG